MKGEKLIGRRAKFTYPDYGYPDSHPDHTAHSGQMVTITAVLGEDEVDPTLLGTVFSIQAADGWKGTANRDELTVKRQ